MRLLQEKNAFSMGMAALAMRLFYAANIDHPELMNAGWIPVTVACLLMLPLLFGLEVIEKDKNLPPAQALSALIGNPALRVYAGILCLFSLAETASVLQMLAGSAQHVALEGFPMWVLIGVSALVALVASRKGSQATGGACRVAGRTALYLLLIVLPIQLRFFNPNWLAPILGPGVRTLGESVFSFAGMIGALLPLWLMREKRPSGFARSLPATLLTAGALAVAFLLLEGMLSPSVPARPDLRLSQLDRLLANGRMSATLQFPMVLIWYLGLIILLAFTASSACAMLLTAIPRLGSWPAAALIAVVSTGLAMLSLPPRLSLDPISVIRLIATGIPALAFVLMACIQKRRRPAHAS